VRGSRWVGGLDFGLRNPFAALWGVPDRDGVLWLTGELYERERSLAYLAEHLPRGVTWYADPAGAREILELKAAGLTITRGDNDENPGIAAVRARVETGTLKVLDGACPNLLAESKQYRYDPRAGEHGQKVLKEYDHALDALRYLVSRIDYLRMARRKGARPSNPNAPPPTSAPTPATRKPPWRRCTRR
jgi:hypothetical protein